MGTTSKALWDTSLLTEVLLWGCWRFPIYFVQQRGTIQKANRSKYFMSSQGHYICFWLGKRTVEMAVDLKLATNHLDIPENQRKQFQDIVYDHCSYKWTSQETWAVSQPGYSIRSELIVLKYAIWLSRLWSFSLVTSKICIVQTNKSSWPHRRKRYLVLPELFV